MLCSGSWRFPFIIILIILISIIIIRKCQPKKMTISSSLFSNVTFVNLCLTIISNYCINDIIRYNLWYDQHSQVSGFFVCFLNTTPTKIVYYYRSFLSEPNVFHVGFHLRNIPNQNVIFYEYDMTIFMTWIFQTGVRVRGEEGWSPDINLCPIL